MLEGIFFILTFRTQEGKCYRVYSLDAHTGLDPETRPEIQRTSLISTVLLLKCIGIADIANFDFVDAPDYDQIQLAEKQLFCLGALDDQGHVTELGKRISQFPVSPFLACSIVASNDLGCVRDMITLAAMLSIEELWMEPRDERKKTLAEKSRDAFMDSSGDHATLINVYEEWRRHDQDREWCKRRWVRWRSLETADKIRDQLKEIAERLGMRWERGNRKSLLLAVCNGYFLHTAKRHANRPIFYHYLQGTGGTLVGLHLSGDSVLNIPMDGEETEWVIYHEVVYAMRAVMRVVSRINRLWVQQGLMKAQTVYAAIKPKAVEDKKPVENIEVQEETRKKRELEVEAAKKRFQSRQRLE